MGVEGVDQYFAASVVTPFLTFPHDWGKEPVRLAPHFIVTFL